MSDHIPDLTKMIGETACNATPREELRHQIMSSIIPKNEREWWANRTIEQLERELNAANKTNRLQYELITTAEKRGVDKGKEELNAANDRIKLMAHELEKVGVECGIAVTNEAIATNKNHKLQQYISRLEQLGDALADAIDESCDPTHANDVTRWRRNKESKP